MIAIETVLRVYLDGDGLVVRTTVNGKQVHPFDDEWEEVYRRRREDRYYDDQDAHG